VVGVPDPELGQRPVAFITVEGTGPTLESLKRSISAEIEYEVAPLEIRILAELPMTPTRKISKGRLASIACGGAATD
jgi:acyl-CoA synthetase (AMP-forming)/AMP-acid ligase II